MASNHMDKLFRPRNIIDTVLGVFAVIGLYSVYNDLPLFERGMVVGFLITFLMIAVYYLIGKFWGYIAKFKRFLDRETKEE
jgi:hypothetical protein